MGFWDNIKATFNKVTEEATAAASRFTNQSFADATMAICAMVAAADGNVDADEKRKTSQFIGSHPALKHFDSAALQQKFSYYCDKLNGSFEFGKMECLEAIGKVKGSSEQARTVIQLGITIGGADGDFDPDEKKVVAEACHACNIDPKQFDL